MGSGEDRGDWVAQKSNGSGDIAIFVVSFSTVKLSISHHLLINIMSFRTSNFYMPLHYVPIKKHFVEVGIQPLLKYFLSREKKILSPTLLLGPIPEVNQMWVDKNAIGNFDCCDCRSIASPVLT